MKTTPEQRRQWREIADAATPGPWNAAVDDECPDDVRVCYVRDGQHCEWCIALCGDVLEPSREWTPETLARWRSDAAFIAAARTAIPALLADVEALEAERDALRTELAQCREMHALKHRWAAEFSGEVQDVAAERDALRAEVDRLREKVSDMRSERVRADEKHKEEVERFKARPNWTNLRAEIEKLNAALTEACDIASAHLTALRSVFGGKADKIESAVARISELRKAGDK